MAAFSRSTQLVALATLAWVLSACGGNDNAASSTLLEPPQAAGVAAEPDPASVEKDSCERVLPSKRPLAREAVECLNAQ